MTDLITVDRVNEVLREIVDEFGEDYVYEKVPGSLEDPTYTVCAYTNPDGSPSCIVGHVYDRLKVERPEYGAPGNTNKAPFTMNLRQRAFTAEAVDRLTTVQRRQDNGSPWGEAIS